MNRKTRHLAALERQAAERHRRKAGRYAAVVVLRDGVRVRLILAGALLTLPNMGAAYAYAERHGLYLIGGDGDDTDEGGEI